MTPETSMSCDVAVVGGGPAGLSAATYLAQSGGLRVTVFERDPEAGGIPRHCGHPPFGMYEFKRVLSGPAYANRLVSRACAAGVDIRTHSSVVSLLPGSGLMVVTPHGQVTVRANRVLLATGVRETPRSARLVSGGRMGGVLNTGALQGCVYLKNMVPFHRPVIVGTELVSFSALLTCRKAGIKPVIMLEEGPAITARQLFTPVPLLFGVPVSFNTQLERIMGTERVGAVLVRGKDGKNRIIECDGVLLTGRFTPESTLARMGHLLVDPATGGPVVDQYGRASDPAFYVAGNMLRPVETAGWCWREGKRIAQNLARDLSGQLPQTIQPIEIQANGPVKYVVPQRFVPGNKSTLKHLQVRLSRPARGELVIYSQETILWRRTINSVPERRILIPVTAIPSDRSVTTLHVDVREDL